MKEELKATLESVDALRAQLDAMRPLTPDQELRAFNKLRLEWNYNSNAIEGNQLSLGETRQFLLEGITAAGKPLKDYLDIKGHDHVIDYLLAFIRDEEELTEAHIRSMQEQLLVQPYKVSAVTPEGGQTQKWVRLGEYKREPNQVKTVTGAILPFALPEETPARMQKLVQRYRQEKVNPTLHPIEFAAAFHHDFVAIHPFDDGNGRMARLLMNLILMQSHYPPAVIPLTERPAYFSALVLADGGDLLPLALLIAEKVKCALEIYLRAASGQNVEDFDDIDKKIALLKQQLNHAPEAIPFTESVYQQFLTTSFGPLVARVFSKLNQFDDLYLKTSLHLIAGQHSVELPKKVEDVLALAAKGPAQRQLILQFRWSGFKRAGTLQFDDAQDLAVTFQELRFEIRWGMRSQQIIQKLYQDRLSEGECHRIAGDMAAECYETIQQNRKAQTTP